jgi:hypothetical protein
MSIFSNIVNAIIGKAKAAGSAIAETVASASTAVTGGSAAAAPKPEPMSRADVEEMIQSIADATNRHNYNWKQSIVDLMKLLDLDSSLTARKQLAQELGYTGALDGSAEMNIWLHKQVMAKLMENGGTVPPELR